MSLILYTIKRQEANYQAFTIQFCGKTTQKKKHLGALSSNNALLKVDYYFLQRVSKKVNSNFSIFRLCLTND